VQRVLTPLVNLSLLSTLQHGQPTSDVVCYFFGTNYMSGRRHGKDTELCNVLLITRRHPLVRLLWYTIPWQRWRKTFFYAVWDGRIV